MHIPGLPLQEYWPAHKHGRNSHRALPFYARTQTCFVVWNVFLLISPQPFKDQFRIHLPLESILKMSVCRQYQDGSAEVSLLSFFVPSPLQFPPPPPTSPPHCPLGTFLSNPFPISIHLCLGNRPHLCHTTLHIVLGNSDYFLLRKST